MTSLQRQWLRLLNSLAVTCNVPIDPAERAERIEMLRDEIAELEALLDAEAPDAKTVH